jgi:uncharacterized protein (TIGR03437 family)
LPVLEAKADHVDFQIPWQLPDTFTYSWPGLQRPGGTFEIVGELILGPLAPKFWTERVFYNITIRPIVFYPLVKAIHQGFDRQVTPGDRARPGEVVHLYMSGLGPVTPVQVDNTPATAPPPTINTPLTCAFGDIPARVLFAGLSVDLVGVYQVELEVPRAQISQAILTCAVPVFGAVINTSAYLPVEGSLAGFVSGTL